MHFYYDYIFHGMLTRITGMLSSCNRSSYVSGMQYASNKIIDIYKSFAMTICNIFAIYI